MISHRARSGVIATCLAFLLPGTGLAQVSDPHLSIEPRTRAEAARIATVTKPATDFTAPARVEANQGGVGTVRRRAGPQAISMPQKNLIFQQDARFNIGNGLFERIWVIPPASTIASDGLGPLLNTRACQNCHVMDGRGHPPAGLDDDAGSLVVRLGIPTDAGPADIKTLRDYLSTKGDPVYGHQFSDLSVAGIPSEGRVRVRWRDADRFDLPGGERVTLRRPVWSLKDLGYGPMDPATHISPRVAPQMIGLGLVEAILASDIIALADPRDADGDGISGRANIVWSPDYDQPMLGRFGVRAKHPDAAPAGRRRRSQRYRRRITAASAALRRLHAGPDSLPGRARWPQRNRTGLSWRATAGTW
ncbi:di-heme oxidoredictase family protein [Paracoccus sp. SM22M-07]|uniref:di-heme oxidoredictase family protein n=1 Tax=Paracoccus sp. SM22M-07 TaxID=1520813 RepID=UPI00352B8BE9